MLLFSSLLDPMTYLTKDNLSKIELPKWPGCDVDGSPVNTTQAMEILVRTCGGYFSSNDREFVKQVERIYYTAVPFPEAPDGEEWWFDDHTYNKDEPQEDRRKRLARVWNLKNNYRMAMGLLNLEYLVNHRVCSSYIGGPHGWCDWTGRIYQRDVNVGKWPSTTDIFDEWKTIAEAFPFLSLECRLLNHEAGYHVESGYESPQIAAVYEVCNGKVKARLPIESDYLNGKITQKSEDDDRWSMLSFMNPGAERGVTLSKWKGACAHVASLQFDGTGPTV